MPSDSGNYLANGKKRSSLNADSSTQIGEIENSPDLLWMVLPKIIGKYDIKVTALADTPVRAWIDGGEIQQFELKKGEKKNGNIIK